MILIAGSVLFVQTGLLAETLNPVPQDTASASALCGVKFNDVNRNCIKDSLEQGLSGWTITLSGPVNGSTTTDSLGRYCFTSLPGGTYTVGEVLKSGWIQTCPPSPGTYVKTVVPGQTIEGVNFGNQVVHDSSVGEAINNLIDTIEGWRLSRGVAASLTAPLTRSSALLSDDNSKNDIAACRELDAFINQINAKRRSKQLTASQAAQLLAAAQELRSALTCAPRAEFGNVADSFDSEEAEEVVNVTAYALHQAHPNPFNPTTNFRFDIPMASSVKLIVYDILGREVETLVNELKLPGRYTVQWDASKLGSGMYFYRLTAGSFVETKKCLLVR